MAKGHRHGKVFEREWYAGMSLCKKRLQGSIRIQRFYNLSDYIGKRCPACKRSLDICGNCGKRLPKSKIQPPRQPGDFETLYKGVNILQELKSSRNTTRYELRYIKTHQMSSLLNNITAGGEGYFLIQNRSKARHFTVYAVNARTLMNYHMGSNKSSIKWDDLSDIATTTIPRLMGGEGKNRFAYYDHEYFCEHVVNNRNTAGVVINKRMDAVVSSIEGDKEEKCTCKATSSFITKLV